MSQSRRVAYIPASQQPTPNREEKPVVDQENIYRTEQYEDEDGYDR